MMVASTISVLPHALPCLLIIGLDLLVFDHLIEAFCVHAKAIYGPSDFLNQKILVLCFGFSLSLVRYSYDVNGSGFPVFGSTFLTA